MKTTRLMFVGALCAMFGLAGCATNRNLPPLPVTQQTEYRLDSGDRVDLIVFGEERLTNTYVVGDKGQISVPLIGEVPVRGLTVSEVEDAVETELRKGIVVSPSVSVQVAEARPFFILGEVANPGQYPYVDGTTVLSAVAIGGGFTFRAEQQNFSVTRESNGLKEEFSAGRDAKILPGDVIFVYERYL